jgi:hypothetical protein
MKSLFKKFYFIFISLFYFIFSFSQSSFALQISEIMYDPVGSDTGNEWVEIYNDTQSSIDVTSLKILEGTTNHGITNYVSHTNTNGNILLPDSYAVIADNPANFLIGHAGFVGNVFDSSFSLVNTGENLNIKSAAGVLLFTVNYIPLAEANGTGGTLNYINNSWIVYAETPSATTTYNTINTPTSNTGTSTNTVGNGSGATSYSAGYTSRSYSLGDIGMLTPREINTVVGADTEFFIKPIDSKKNVISTNTYWSYGDGSEGYGTSTKHRYQNAGEYTAVVESEISNAYGIERINVKVLNPDIKISEVGENFIKIKNNSDEELNIGGFIISADQGMHKFSRFLILKAKSEIKIDGRVLGFAKLTNVKILSAYNTIITTYLIPEVNLSSEIKIEDKRNIQNLENISPDYTGLKLRKTENKKEIVQQLNKKEISKKITFKKSVAKKNVPAQKAEIKNTVSTSTEIKAGKNKQENKTATNTVDNTPIKKDKNWLYWLYE